MFPLCLLVRRDMMMIQRAECFVYPLPLLIANHKQANLSTIQANVRIKKCYFGPKCGLQSARDAASHDSITFDIMLLVPCQSCLLVKAHRELNHSMNRCCKHVIQPLFGFKIHQRLQLYH